MNLAKTKKKTCKVSIKDSSISSKKANGNDYMGIDMVEDQRTIKHAYHKHDTHMHARVGKVPFN